MNLDNEPEVTITPLTGKERIARITMFTLGACFISFVVTIGSCTTHSNSYDPARLREQLVIDKERTAAIERLTDKGVHPITTRCAIEGWSKKKPDVVCMAAINTQTK